MKTLPALLVLLSAAVAWGAAPPPLSNQEVKTVVESHLGEVKACLGEHGKATGKLVVEFAILPDGRVDNPRPKEHSSNAALDRCIAGKFAGWAFPKPRGGLTMGAIYPFVFTVPPPPGTLEDAQVAEVIKARQPEIRACHAAAVKDKPVLGRVEVALVVTPAGAVKDVKVQQSSTGSAKLDACIVERIQAWVFPAPAGGRDCPIILPFSFTPEPKKEEKKE